jgi:hypothetical protein
VRLNKRIIEMTSAEGVLQLVEETGASFNSVNAATAFHRLARVRTANQNDCLSIVICQASEVAGAGWKSAVDSSAIGPRDDSS